MQHKEERTEVLTLKQCYGQKFFLTYLQITRDVCKKYHEMQQGMVKICNIFTTARAHV